jgi:hypothetical protein
MSRKPRALLLADLRSALALRIGIGRIALTIQIDG